MIEDNNRVYSPQVRSTDVMINVVDCMKCYVRLTKCEVNLVLCNKDNTLIVILTFFYSNIV